MYLNSCKERQNETQYFHYWDCGSNYEVTCFFLDLSLGGTSCRKIKFFYFLFYISFNCVLANIIFYKFLVLSILFGKIFLTQILLDNGFTLSFLNPFAAASLQKFWRWTLSNRLILAETDAYLIKRTWKPI